MTLTCRRMTEHDFISIHDRAAKGHDVRPTTYVFFPLEKSFFRRASWPNGVISAKLTRGPKNLIMCHGMRAPVGPTLGRRLVK